MTQERTPSTESQDALNALEEGTDAIDPERMTSLASRVTGGFESGTLPIAGGGLLLLGAIKQLRHRRGRAILQALAGASLLAVGLRRREASGVESESEGESKGENENELDPLEGDQGVSDAPGTVDDLGESAEKKRESDLDAGGIVDEISSGLTDRVPISDESAGPDETGADAQPDTDEQLDVHVTGAPGSGDPDFDGESDGAGRQDETDVASSDEGADDEGSGDEQLGQDETDADADADLGDDDDTDFGDDIGSESEGMDEGESDENTPEDELSEENEDKDEDIRGP
ncbi:hypothetical protein [Halomontanus rarus]|uniref:hypothetical protein n=1 Tax=Halomontanus rarus TaxID=3034020 RepID=UPI0023E8CE78|nr:hypothetical protein [Halovivax sp. TS33]